MRANPRREEQTGLTGILQLLMPLIVNYPPLECRESISNTFPFEATFSFKVTHCQSDTLS